MTHTAPATAFATMTMGITETLSLANYLVARGKQGTWQLRVPVPRGLQQSYGKRERTVSLRTTDRQLAVRRALPILTEWQAAFAQEASVGEPKLASQHHQKPSIPQIEEAAVIAGYDLELEEIRRSNLAFKGQTWNLKFSRDQHQHEIDRLKDALAAENYDASIPLVDALLRELGWSLSKNTPEYEHLCISVHQAKLEAHATALRLANGELEPSRTSALIERVKSRESSKAKEGETLLELYDSYSAWRGAPGRKHRRRPESFRHDRPAVELFAEWLGYDRAVSSITRDEARAFRAMLAGFPASRGKNKRLASMSLSECVEIAKRENIPLMSLTTQAKYLSILSPFFGWLASDSPVNIGTNPFSGLNHKLEKGENRRPSLKADQLSMLLGSPLFSTCGGSGREHCHGTEQVRDWRYWIPLICMFTGSRITEVAQLRVDDVALRDGVASILLTHDEDRGQFVKSKRGRLAVLHPLLERLGFLDYVDERKRLTEPEGTNQLFPTLSAGSRRLLGDAPARWFRRYLERIGLKDGADGFGAHSFRHTMADAMRAAGYIDAEFGQLILGHANNSITAAYGSIAQGTPERLLVMLSAAFKAEPFSKVPFEHLLLGQLRRRPERMA